MFLFLCDMLGINVVDVDKYLFGLCLFDLYIGIIIHHSNHQLPPPTTTTKSLLPKLLWILFQFVEKIKQKQAFF